MLGFTKEDLNRLKSLAASERFEGLTDAESQELQDLESRFLEIIITTTTLQSVIVSLQEKIDDLTDKSKYLESEARHYKKEYDKLMTPVEANIRYNESDTNTYPNPTIPQKFKRMLKL